MPLFTIIIPTHSHVATLHWAIKSVMDQSIQDFELIVVGDGAPPATEVLLKQWCAQDSRIQFQRNEKGEGYGERHRHCALQGAKGELVAYLGDDDIWLENHLQILADMLEHNDFAHTVQANVEPSGKVSLSGGRFDTPYGRNSLLELGFNAAGPTCVGHTLAAYNKLPFGWRPKPENQPSDTHMWKQWFSQKDLQIGYSLTVSALHIGSPAREKVSMPDEQRGQESEHWYLSSRDDNFATELIHDALSRWQLKQLHYKHERDMIDALVSGESPSVESVAMLAIHYSQYSGGGTGFVLRKAILAQKNSQNALAKKLYGLIEVDIKTTPDQLLQARYLLNAGDAGRAEQLLLSIDSTDPEMVVTREKLQRRAKRKMASDPSPK